MIRLATLVTPTALLTCLIALSGCDAPQGGQAQADAATRAACQQRANQAYDQQNRGEIYSSPANINTPYSANVVPGMSDRGLSDLFAHDRMVSDCVRNTGTGTERSPAAPPPSPPAAPRAAPPPAH
jgi:hypothetical protein